MSPLPAGRCCSRCPRRRLLCARSQPLYTGWSRSPPAAPQRHVRAGPGSPQRRHRVCGGGGGAGGGGSAVPPLSVSPGPAPLSPPRPGPAPAGAGWAPPGRGCSGAGHSRSPPVRPSRSRGRAAGRAPLPRGSRGGGAGRELRGQNLGRCKGRMEMCGAPGAPLGERAWVPPGASCSPWRGLSERAPVWCRSFEALCLQKGPRSLYGKGIRWCKLGASKGFPSTR